MPASTSSKAQIPAHSFKSMVDAVSKFPSIGGYSGSDTINLEIKDGVASVSVAGGVVSSFSSCEATGTLPVVALNDKLIYGFANLCGGDSPVTIEVKDKEIVLRCKSERVSHPFKQGVRHAAPVIEKIDGAIRIDVTDEVAEKFGYLASFAFNDQCMPELCCVYVHPSKKMLSFAVHICGVFDVDVKAKTGAPIPLPLAKELIKGDIVYAGSHETAVWSGKSIYTMPTPVAAIAGFPHKMLLEFANIPRDLIVECTEAALADAARKFSMCLGSLSREEIKLRATVADGRFALHAENAGASYNTVVRGAEHHKDAIFYFPLNDLSKVMESSGTDANISIYQGKKGGEVFLVFESGWIVFGGHKSK